MLTYNTHGLPAWVARDDPERRFPKIGSRLDDYDVVLLQEDFAYHELLRPTLHHAVVARGNPSRFEGTPLCWLACDGSGLTFLWRGLPAHLLSLANVPYHRCSGWLGGANDCLATKGFQHARIELPGGLDVDVVNTHLDAGRGEGDREARSAQLARLRRHLEREADGAALIVGGDLNLDDADPADAALRDELARALGLRDSGARPGPGGGWERLDYLFFRNGEGVSLSVLESGEAGGFADGERPLSDHPALFARFRVSAAQRSESMPPSTGITAPVR